MRSWIVYLVVALLWLSGCAKDTAEEPADLTDYTREAKIKSLWTRDTGSGSGENGVILKPWFTSTTIFIANDDGRLVSLDKETGKVNWKVETDLPISGGVGGGASMIFVGTGDGKLLAFWQRNGELVWQVDVNSEILAPPTAEQGVVVARTTDGNLSAFSVGTGERLWTYRFSVPSLSLVGTATPVIHAGGVICGGDDGRLTVVSLSTGKVLWDLPISASTGASELSRVTDVDIPVLVDERMLFVASYQGRVAAVSTNNGKVIWARDRSVHLPLSLDNDNLYVVNNRSFVSALNRYTGSTVWVQEELRARPVSGAAVVKDMVVLGDYKGYLHVLDSSDGRIVARSDLGSRINVQPYVDGDRLYVIGENGKISALTIERIASAD